jgi:thiol-disulfide isomerase/thioredoxin
VSAAVPEKLQLLFFYSPTCPHCRVEEPFLNGLEQKYPELNIKRYIASDFNNQLLMQRLLESHASLEYFGSVPVTFIGNELFLGFDNADGIGNKMESSIIRQIELLKPEPALIVPIIEQSEPPSSEEVVQPEAKEELPAEKLKVTTIGIDKSKLEKYSLPVLALALGALDGFNVCSLGALLLILSLVLVLRSRRQVFIYGGIFLFTTALIYGLLIVFWHQLFSALGQYVRVLDFTLAVLGIGGAIYFFREFIRFKLYGPACEVGGVKLIGKMSRLVEKAFGSKGNILLISGSIFLFAAVVTIVEFPCSAAVPVMFAGILTKANLPDMTYLGYLALFLMFYLIDELVVFGVAIWKLSLWMDKEKFVTYAALIQAILLLLLGGYYLLSFIR